ncbi:MAG: tRNA pseudouridine(38-40) synthase TruA [Rubricoccaceae bacterium]|nr:tRNA pseudouridine(38-40) synthase TruA [Rubricoccaceae bacterium]
MARYRLLLEYDGSAFNGWQKQPTGHTVQQALEDALSTALRQPISVVGSGRTDSGVHARGQVVHFDSEARILPAGLTKSLNGLLPESVAVLVLEKAPETFHARFDAVRRSYHYQISTQPRALDRSVRAFVRPEPDFQKMSAAARDLIGTHNFNSFCIAKSETKNRICTVEHAEWVPEARHGDWRFEISADRFLHGMVRAIVGTLLKIGQGRLEPKEIQNILHRKDRRAAGPAAAAHGLVLHEVIYPDPIFKPN